MELFIPPQNPSATSSLPESFGAVPRTESYSDNGSRKRLRFDSNSSLLSQRIQALNCESKCEHPTSSQSTPSTPAESPAPLVNIDYRLAGGLDTPTAALALNDDRQDDISYGDLRASRFSSRPWPDTDSYFPRAPDLLSRESNGRKRAPSSQDQLGWGRAVVSAVGLVAGKVFNFCWNSAFPGFYAGSGEGYRMDVNTPVVITQNTWIDIGKKMDVFDSEYDGLRYREPSPVPGEFPEEGYFHDYMSHPQSHLAQGLMSPIDYADSCDRECMTAPQKWVMVKRPLIDSREASPTRAARKVPRTSIFSNNGTLTSLAPLSRPPITPSRNSHMSFACFPALEPNRPASYASPRQSLVQNPAAKSNRPSTSQAGHVRNKSSFASPRGPENATPSRVSIANQPHVSPDVQRFEKKMRREKKAESQHLDRMDNQLQQMLREAKQALATRIDIEDEDEEEVEDEGYGEGPELWGESKW